MAFRFQNFKVYKDSKEFIKSIYTTTKKFPKKEQFGLTAQLRNAAISIALNIAEGSDSGSDKEFNRFIQMSIGSINEVVAALDIALDNGYLDEKTYDSFLSHAESIVKQLSNFSKRLKGCKL
jgi:four helix bundle protein